MSEAKLYHYAAIVFLIAPDVVEVVVPDVAITFRAVALDDVTRTGMEAMKRHLDQAKKDGRQIPEPRSLPDVIRSPRFQGAVRDDGGIIMMLPLMAAPEDLGPQFMTTDMEIAAAATPLEPPAPPAPPEPVSAAEDSNILVWWLCELDRDRIAEMPDSNGAADWPSYLNQQFALLNFPIDETPPYRIAPELLDLTGGLTEPVRMKGWARSIFDAGVPHIGIVIRTEDANLIAALPGFVTSAIDMRIITPLIAPGADA